MKLTGIDTESWEAFTLGRDGWRHALSSGVKRGEEMRILQLRERRDRRRTRQENAADTLHSELVCPLRQRLSCKDWAAEPFETLLSAVPMTTRRIPLSLETEGCLLLHRNSGSTEFMTRLPPRE